MPTDLPRRHNTLIQPLPNAGAILFVAMLSAGYFALGSQKEETAAPLPHASVQSGRAVATAIHFPLCSAPPHVNCVMDGDTFFMNGESIRIADIDAPETHPARCAYEAELGDRATHRLRELLNAEPFRVTAYERDTDRHGRKLRIIARNGESIGGMLVTEGLARPWSGKRTEWCR